MAREVEEQQRILVAEDVEAIAFAMVYTLKKQGFVVESVSCGELCLEKIRTFKPHLILLDLMMPKYHGLEILQILRSNPETANTGVIISTVTNFKAEQDRIEELGCDGVIMKPIDHEEMVTKVQNFFGVCNVEAHRLQRAKEKAKKQEVYLPTIDYSQGYIKLWGTRGSIPVSDSKFLRHGGNTSCMSMEVGDELLVFDAGSGIRDLGSELVKGKPRTIHLFVTHTHWDHIQGFPFFAPAYVPGFKVIVYGMKGFGKDLESLFRGQLDSDYFPVQMEDMRGDIRFEYLSSSDSVTVGRCEVTWTFVHHPGATVGFKIKTGKHTIAWLPDNEFLCGYLGKPHGIAADHELILPYKNLIDFISDVDVMVSEAQYMNDEYANKIGWGHSSISNACLLMELAGVERWIVTHHDPEYTDDFLDHKLCLTRQVMAEIQVGKPRTRIYHGYDGMLEYLL